MAKCKFNFSRKDLLFTIAAIVFALANFAAVGSRGRSRAKEAVCLSNMRQWGATFDSYTRDHNGYFNRGWDVGETTLWMNALRPYYEDRFGLLLCPTASRAMVSPGDWGPFRAAFRDCDLPGGGSYRYTFSYSINSWTNYMTRDRGSRLERCFWKNVFGVQGKEKIPVFADATWHDAWPRHTDEPPKYPGDFGSGTSMEMNHFCIDRHNGGISCLFMDWSARKVGPKELWTLKWHREFDNVTGPWTSGGGVQPTMWPVWMRDFKDY